MCLLSASFIYFVFYSPHVSLGLSLVTLFLVSCTLVTIRLFSIFCICPNHSRCLSSTLSTIGLILNCSHITLFNSLSPCVLFTIRNRNLIYVVLSLLLVVLLIFQLSQPYFRTGIAKFLYTSILTFFVKYVDFLLHKVYFHIFALLQILIYLVTKATR